MHPLSYNQFICIYVTCLSVYACTQELICSTGAKAFLIPNNFPIGCFASYLSRFHSDNPEDYDEHGCLRWFNEFSQTHNEQLYSAIGRINITYPDVKLIYADYYNATMEFIKNPGRFGEYLLACVLHVA